MKFDITPEPGADERAALLAALREVEREDAGMEESRWRQAVLEADDDRFPRESPRGRATP